MARSANTDPLLAHNFALLEIPVAGLLPLAFPQKTIESAVGSGSFVGFKSIDMPEVSIEMKQIKEGNWPYIHSVSTGFVDSGEVTLEFALFPRNTDMWVYFQQAIWGRIAPRRSFIVVCTRPSKSTIQRVFWLEECLPKTWSPVSGMDATSSEVLMEKIVLDVHRIRVVPTPNSIDGGNVITPPGFNF
jgi:phage tail-like protein